MGFLFPWTNLHEINLDWLLDRVKHIPTKTSQLINDSGYITQAQAAPVQSVNGQTGDVVLNIPDRTSELINDSGFITQAQAAPVQSVNGQTGAVVLTAADVGAKPASYAAPVDSVNGRTGTVVLTAADVGAKPSSYAAPVDSVNGQTGAVVIGIPDPSSSNPLMDGTVSIGSSDDYARADHRHPKDTSKANLASPTFTGAPKAPTAAAGTSTTQIATTAFVQEALLTNVAGSLTAASVHSGVTVRSASYTQNNRVVQFNAALNITTAQTNESVLFTCPDIKGPATQCTVLARSSSTGNIVSIALQNVNNQLTVVAFGEIPVGDWLFVAGTFIQQV